jgi:hypothetical protein
VLLPSGDEAVARIFKRSTTISATPTICTKSATLALEADGLAIFF